MTRPISRLGVMLLLIGCQVLSGCEGGRQPTSPTSPTLVTPVVPRGPGSLNEGGTFSMTIVSIEDPFDCVLQTLNGTEATPQNLRVTIHGTRSLLESRHFGTSDTWGSVRRSETHYEFTAAATGFRWYGSPPSPVRDGVCPQEFAEYVITSARFPVEVIASTAASTRGMIDLMITAAKYSDTAGGWVPFGETRVTGEVIRVQ